MNTVNLYASDYFKTLNSIASRISVDIATTRDAYEDLWHTLSLKDKDQIIDETIIHPKVSLRYSVYANDFPEAQSATKYTHVPHAVSLKDDCVKEGGLDCQDEHSAPFSWMTQSQLNLSILDDSLVSKDKHSSVSPGKGVCQTVAESGKHIRPVSKSSFDPPSLVLGGSTSKLNSSNTSSEPKFPQKNPGTEDSSFFSKLKGNTAMLKIQSFKSDGKKIDTEIYNKKNDAQEKESLMKSKTKCTIAPANKSSKSAANKCMVSKPKNPPPPPPSASAKNKGIIEHKEETRESGSKKKLLLSNVAVKEISLQSTNEAKPLLPDECFEDFQISLSDSMKATGYDVPKTGFDFLDNW